MKMKKLYTMFLLFLLFVFLTASIGVSGEVIDRILERGYVVVGTSGDLPPLTMRAKDGEMIGLDMDIALIIAMSMGVELGVEQLPFPELIPALESGKVDMIISSMTIPHFSF